VKRDNRSAGQNVSSFLWNLKVHYHVHKSLSVYYILIQINPVHILKTQRHKTRVITEFVKRRFASYEFSSEVFHEFLQSLQARPGIVTLQ
jgi:hypothetical protein